MLGDELIASGEGMREDPGGGGLDGGVHAVRKSKAPTTSREELLSACRRVTWIVRRDAAALRPGRIEAMDRCAHLGAALAERDAEGKHGLRIPACMRRRPPRIEGAAR